MDHRRLKKMKGRRYQLVVYRRDGSYALEVARVYGTLEYLIERLYARGFTRWSSVQSIGAGHYRIGAGEAELRIL